MQEVSHISSEKGGFRYYTKSKLTFFPNKLGV